MTSEVVRGFPVPRVLGLFRIDSFEGSKPSPRIYKLVGQLVAAASYDITATDDLKNST